mmetsp:Transcript_7010/g.18297  ORF Transcript_7010/g.18297 Transcript_7010/m.18297 type:complete len:480 (+) Transcript_7010:98-1537(+)
MEPADWDAGSQQRVALMLDDPHHTSTVSARSRAARAATAAVSLLSACAFAVAVASSYSASAEARALPVLAFVNFPEKGLAVSIAALPHLDAEGIPTLSDMLLANGSRVVWGICGAGRIAHDFTAALKAMGAEVGAVAAGSLLGNTTGRAAEFARVYSIPVSYGSYDELAKDARVTAVYIATINNLHFANAKLMLASGKHVLLEKPATVGVPEFESLVALAADYKLLFVTNYWSRFFPAFIWAKSVATSGLLGAIVHIQGDLAFQAMTSSPAGDRFFKRALGGGAVLDMGCYLVQFAANFLPQPHPTEDVDSAASFAVSAVGRVEDGVDLDVAFTIATERGSASFGTSLTRASDFALQIYCEHGKVSLASPANCPVEASYTFYADAMEDPNQPTPCCGQPELETRRFAQPLPAYPTSLLAHRAYPNGMGFVYVASAFERCLYTPGCTELPELSTSQQRLIEQLTAKVLGELGIYQDAEKM